MWNAHDRARGAYRAAKARNWTHLGDRMNCIVNVFRARQEREALYEIEPLTAADRRVAQGLPPERPSNASVMTRPPFTDSYLDALQGHGDPVADAVVADFVQVRHITDPQYVVLQLIQHQRRLPPAEQIPSVRAYFDTPVPLPPWADVAVLRRGQEIFRVFGVHIASALFCASLPMSYAAVDGSQVLTRTAELVSNTRRRLAHTGEMLLDVMGANDDRAALPFAPGTHAYDAPHGVRLFHAAVRHLLRNDAEYQRVQPGEPINQEDLLGTLTVFTVVVVEALQRFGVHLDAAQRDAYVRVWLTAGYLLGIEPDRTALPA